jgi:hypothetical protein
MSLLVVPKILDFHTSKYASGKTAENNFKCPGMQFDEISIRSQNDVKFSLSTP